MQISRQTLVLEIGQLTSLSKEFICWKIDILRTISQRGSAFLSNEQKSLKQSVQQNKKTRKLTSMIVILTI